MFGKVLRHTSYHLKFPLSLFRFPHEPMSRYEYPYYERTNNPSTSQSSSLDDSDSHNNPQNQNHNDKDKDDNDNEEPSCVSMFFTKLADKIGLLDKMAPRKKRARVPPSSQQQQQQQKQPPPPPSSSTLPPSRPLPTAEQIKRNHLQTQLLSEQHAATHNLYAPNQRVQYHYRAQDCWYDALVLAIHLDDGPNHPYYVSPVVVVVSLCFVCHGCLCYMCACHVCV